MRPQDRILDAALRVFRRHGYRRSSIEQAAEAAGLTRQALYHHFQSKEALFRAVIEQLYESALAAETTAADAAVKAGGDLANILVAQLKARLKHLVGSFEGSPHIEELFSEHLALGRDLYQKYAAAFAAQIAATIEQACRRQRLALAKGMTVSTLARYIGMAMHGAKSAYPSMQPIDAFLKDFEVMVRTLVAGAVATPSKQLAAKPVRATRSKAGKTLGRIPGKSLGKSL